jgi:hypothetical protein
MQTPNKELTPQARRLLDYLEDHGSITPFTAWVELGIYRLADTVFKLRGAGYPVITRQTTGKNRFNEKVRYATYRLEKEEAAA